MVDFVTPNLNYVAPEVGGSVNTWGDKLNDNIEKQDTDISARVLRGGDSMQGALGWQAGTEALPGLFAVGDSDTGFYSPAANMVGITTGGVGRFLLSNTLLSLGVGLMVSGSTALSSVAYTGTLTGGTGIVNFGNQVIKTAAGNLLVGGTNDFPNSYITAGNSTANVAIVRVEAEASNTATFCGFVANGPGVTALVMGTGGAPGPLGGNTAFIYTSQVKPIKFGIGEQESAVITTGRFFKASNTGVYTNVADLTHEFNSNQNNVNLEIRSTNTGSSVFNVNSDLVAGATGFHFRGRLDGVNVYQVLANGNVQNANNSYGAISMRSLKNLIAQKTGADYWEKFKQVKFWIYSLIADPTNQQLLGVVAEELEELWPGLIERTQNTIKVKKTRQVEQTMQVTVVKLEPTTRTEFVEVGGKWVQKTINETVEVAEPQFDIFPVYDEAGSPVMQLVTPEIQAVPAQGAVLGKDGNVIQPAIPAVEYQAAVYEPLTHKVPRMETVTVTEDYEDAEWDGTYTLAVKYSILGLIADTITQELQFRVEDLTTRLTALEAK